MKKLLQSIEASLLNKNWHSALALSLMLPDICGSMEGKPQGAKRYCDWFTTYFCKEYQNCLSSNDCYALRCSFVHEGIDSIECQRKKDVLDKFVFISQGSHRNKIKQHNIKSPKYHNKVVLQLSVERFCKDFIEATYTWLGAKQSDPVVQLNLKNILEIHENGVSIGAVRIQQKE